MEAEEQKGVGTGLREKYKKVTRTEAGTETGVETGSGTKIATKIRQEEKSDIRHIKQNAEQKPGTVIVCVASSLHTQCGACM